MRVFTLAIALSSASYVLERDEVLSALRSANRIPTEDVDKSSEFVRKLCQTVADNSMEYARWGNRNLHDYFLHPEDSRLSDATALIQLDRICQEQMIEFSLPLRYSIFRQKLVSYHSAHTSPATGGSLKFESYEGIAGAPLSTLLYKVDVGKLADFFEYRLLTKRTIDGCRPFTFHEAQLWLSIDPHSKCTSDQLVGIGRAIGLSILHSVPYSKSFNPQFIPIMLGKTSGWTLDELRGEEPYRYDVLPMNQARIDHEVYGRFQSQYSALANGFQEIVAPEVLASGVLSSSDVIAITRGDIDGRVMDVLDYILDGNEPETKWIKNYARMTVNTKYTIYRLLTERHYLPVGGTDAFIPSLRIEVVKGAPGIRVDRDRYTLVVPECESEEDPVSHLALSMD